MFCLCFPAGQLIWRFLVCIVGVGVIIFTISCDTWLNSTMNRRNLAPQSVVLAVAVLLIGCTVGKCENDEVAKRREWFWKYVCLINSSALPPFPPQLTPSDATNAPRSRTAKEWTVAARTNGLIRRSTLPSSATVTNRICQDRSAWRWCSRDPRDSSVGNSDSGGVCRIL